MKKNRPELEGIVKRHPDGFGFFIADDADQPDVYIPRGSMQGVMSNDRVRVRVEREPGGERFRGEVVQVLERAVARVMGQFRPSGAGRGSITDKSFGWGEDLRLTVPAGIEPKDGELVVVQIEEYPGSKRGFSGRVISVIGDMADPMNDSARMLHAHNIPTEFSREALAEAKRLDTEVQPREWADRKDLRQIPICTIDGNTAKDFDDAVYVEKVKKGFRLIVAIADVSHYVREGSAIDKDAYLRGTSTYFPNFVAPMLPEALSNELCSLKPNVPRLALVADMELDHKGGLYRTELYEAVILSHARVTYGEAQEIVEGKSLPKFKAVEGNIRLCADLSRLLLAKRQREGSLDLDLPETEIQVDDGGVPTDIMQSERLFAHRLIEELMLTANVAVAKFFKDKKVDAIYRIHEEPQSDAMQNFNNFLKAFGYKHRLLFAGGLAKKITRALEHFKGHPKEHILNMLALRSLMQAKYSPHNVGHFGLGFPDYTHFTSPIRRYPDLIVHRLIKAVLYPQKGYRIMPMGDLETAGTVLSANEQRSVKAERQIRSIKKARFMQRFVGETFDGTISSVTKFGIFVLLRQFDVDGLVRVEELGGDRYEFDEEQLRLVGRKSGEVFEIGTPVKVQVAKADVEAGQIDFVLPDRAGSDRARGANRGARQDRPDRQNRPVRTKAMQDVLDRLDRGGGGEGGMGPSKRRGGAGGRKASETKTQSGRRGRSGKKDVNAADDQPAKGRHARLEKPAKPVQKRRSTKEDPGGPGKPRVSRSRRPR